MSVIQVKCVDQTMALMSTPVITSGGIQEDQVSFDFCPLWDGYTRTAVFWRTANDPHYRVLDEANICDVPDEVLVAEGAFYFGVFGVNAEGIQRTTGVLKYNIGPGILNAGTEPLAPTPDIYVQLLAGYAKLEAAVLAATQATASATNVLQQTARDLDRMVAEEVGNQAVKNTGGTVTGNMTIQKENPVLWLNDDLTGAGASVVGADNVAVLQNRNVAGDNKNRRQLNLHNSNSVADVNEALKLVDVNDGKGTTYNVLHTGTSRETWRNLKILQMVVGEYTGTGGYAETSSGGTPTGGSYTNSLTFPFVPRVVHIAKVLEADIGVSEATVLYGQNRASTSPGAGSAIFFWSPEEGLLPDPSKPDDPCTLSWRAVAATYQLNEQGETYRYVAIG